MKSPKRTSADASKRCVGVVACCVLASIIGCARVARRDAVVRVESARRDDLFNATRETLRARGYTLDRVDSAQGVITTHEKHSGGLPTRSAPLEDVLHQQSRTIRVTFEDNQQWCIATLTCAVRRLAAPALRLSPVSSGLSSQSLDTRLRERGLAYRFASPSRLDEAEAGEIAAEVRRRLEPGASSPQR